MADDSISTTATCDPDAVKVDDGAAVDVVLWERSLGHFNDLFFR